MAHLRCGQSDARPYKKAWEINRAVSLIQEESGQHFDPKQVERFMQVLPQVLELKEKYAQSTPTVAGGLGSYAEKVEPLGAEAASG